MDNFDVTKYFKNQYINEAYSLPNSDEMGKEEDAKILMSNIEKAIGKIDDGFGSGGYNGKDGYYLRVYSLRYWEDKEVNVVKKAIDLTNKQTEKYNFEFHDTTDFETDIDDDRTWPASISFFAEEKSIDEIDVESYSPKTYAKRIASGDITIEDAMEETGFPYTTLMTMVKKIKNVGKSLNEGYEEMIFKYLNNLRDSGVTNMFGASPYLQDEFGLDRKESREMLAKWMRSFDEDKNEIDRDRIFMKGKVDEIDMNDPVLVRTRADRAKMDKFKKDQEQKIQNAKLGGAKEKPLRKLANMGKIAFLEKEKEQLMRDMEQEAEPEGGPIADEYGRKLNRIDQSIAKLKGRKEMTYDQAIAEGHSLEDKDIEVLKDAFNVLFVQNPDWKGSSDLRRIIQNLIDTNDVSGIQEIAETIKLGEGMIEEELCAKGKAYRKRRIAAGEKSSAYLSGRAVKVCKGQMSGKKKKK